MKNFNKNIIFIFVLLQMLNGCGFHLAGTGEFSDSLQNTSVHSDTASRELINLVERNLIYNQIKCCRCRASNSITQHTRRTNGKSDTYGR